MLQYEPVGMGMSFVPPRRYASVSSDVPPVDSNVLRKVVSLTLAEQQQSAQPQSSSLKPKLIPEKLNFKLYEKFEGQVLVNWVLSSFGEDAAYLRSLLSPSDFRNLAMQLCSLLLAAGVLKQIDEDSSSDSPNAIDFRPDFMYYWAHSESPAISTNVPGKLPPVAWPPTKESSSSSPRPGAKYTEAGKRCDL